MTSRKGFRTSNIRQSNVTIIKREGHYVRVVNLSSVRIAGFELADGQKVYTEKGTVNSEKLDCNIVRAKSKVRELARCNAWQYFCTFTIDQKKFDRFNFAIYYKAFSKFINNYNNRFLPEGEKLSYILIPEKHKNGAWHVHGLINGIRPCDMYKNRYGYLTWTQYEEKFGFISMSQIQDVDRVALYITKYITKEVSSTVRELGAHMFYHSKGLRHAELLASGQDISLLCDYDYEDPDKLFRVKEFDDLKDDYRDYIIGIDED